MSDNDANLAFGRFLKFWRSVHEMSQEYLAAQINSSPRHISRLENGISRPSQTMLLEIASALNLGQRDRNHLLIAAGFLPNHDELNFHAPELKWLRKSMMLSLRALDPYPTTLTNDASDILMVNRGWVALYGQMTEKSVLDEVVNTTDFFFSAQGASAFITGREDFLSVLLMSYEQRALFSNEHRDHQRRDRLARQKFVPPDWQQRAAKLEPTASFRLQISLNGQLHKFISVNSAVSAHGPAAVMSGPSLLLNTLYPEDALLDLSQYVHDGLRHPLLYY